MLHDGPNIRPENTDIRRVGVFFVIRSMSMLALSHSNDGGSWYQAPRDTRNVNIDPVRHHLTLGMYPDRAFRGRTMADDDGEREVQSASTHY